MQTVTIYAIANVFPAPAATDAQAVMPVRQIFIPFYEGEVYEFEIVLFRDWETKAPAVLPDGIEWWTFAMDVDFDDATPLPVNMSNREPAHASEITVIQTAEETRIRIHCWQFGIYMSRFIGEYGYRDGVIAELVGYDPAALEEHHCSSFVVPIDNIMIGRPFDEMPIYAIANTFPAWLRDPQNMTRVDGLFFPVKKGHGLVFDIVLFKEEFSSEPAVLPEGIVSWRFAIDSDLDKQSEPVVLGDNDQITAFQSESETRIRVPCSSMGGQAVLEYIGQTGYRFGLYAELAGYNDRHRKIFTVPIRGIRIGAPCDEPGHHPDCPGILPRRLPCRRT